MKRLTIAAVLASSLATGAGAFAVFSRPQGEFRSSLGRLEYSPSSSCFKPTRPYSNEQWARDNYVRQGKAYLACLENAATSDMKYAEIVIQEGYSRAVDDFLNEVKRGY